MAYIGLNPNTPLLNTSTQLLSGNGATLQFALTRSIATASDLDVIVGTTLQRPFIDYVANNTTLTFTSAPALGTNNISVTYRAGALNTLSIDVTVFQAGTVGAPSLVSVAANNTGIYWPNGQTVAVTAQGSNIALFNSNTTSVGYDTGAIVVKGGIGANGNIHSSGQFHSFSTIESNSISTGALLIDGGAGIAGNVNIGGSVTILRDLVVNGNFSTTGTDSLVVEDPFIFLANANPGDSLDIGIIGQYYDGSANRYTGYFRDVTDGRYKFFTNLTERPTTIVDTANASFQYAEVVALNFSATGNVSGNYFIGNGAFLTGITYDTTQILNGNSKVIIPAINGNIVSNVNAVTITTISAGGLAVTGNITASGFVSATGNVDGGNLRTAGQVSATGNVSSGNINTAGQVSATGNITGGNILATSALSAAGNLVSSGFVSIGGAASSVNVGSGQTTGITTIGGTAASGAIQIGRSTVTQGIFIANGVVASGNTKTVSIGENGAAGSVSNINLGPALGTGLISTGAATVVAIANTGGLALSVAGNITGGNLNTTGVFSTSGNILAANIGVSGLISAAGNVIGGAFSTTGTGGNISGANVISANVFSATGDITGGNISTAGFVTATGNVTGGNIITSALLQGGTLSITGGVTFSTAAQAINIGSNQTTGNILIGSINQTGFVTVGRSTATQAVYIANGIVSSGNTKTIEIGTNGAANSITNISIGTNAGNANVDFTANTLVRIANTSGSALSVAGNVTGANFATAGLLTATGNITGGNIRTAGLVTAAGNVFAAGFVTTGTSGNISGANVVSANIFSASGNVTGGNILTAGQVSATGNVTGDYILGNGALLTGVITSVAGISNGTSNIDIATANGNATVGIGGTGNIVVFASTGLFITGVASASGNVYGNNITAAGFVTATGNVDGANIGTAGIVTAAGNVYGNNFTVAGFITATGNVDGGNIRTAGVVSATGNLTGNNISVGTTGNIGGGNLSLSGTVTVSGNSYLGGVPGTESLRVPNVASAVNYVQISGAATSSGPSVIAQGSDSFIGLSLQAKSATLSLGTRVGGNPSLQLLDSGSSPANYLRIVGAATTFAPVLSAQGSDTNISQVFQSKGTGAIDLAAGSSGVNISNGGTVTAITGTAGGSYTVIPTITISAPTTLGGVQATANVAMNAATITLASGGTGYAIGDTITLTGGTFSTSIILTVATLSGSAVATFTAVQTGTYTVLPTNPISQGSTSGGGSGATFNVTAWNVRTTAYIITNAGSGYVEQPTITFSSGTAAAYATVGGLTVLKSLSTSSNFQTAFGVGLQIASFGSNNTSGTNYFQTYASGSGNPSILNAAGVDSSIDAVMSSKSTASVRFFTNSYGLGTGVEQLRVSHTANAVNYLNATGGITGNPPVLSATGSDGSIALNINTKGTGGFNFYSGAGAYRQFRVDGTNLAVNYLQIAGNAANSTPTLSAQGSDTDVAIAMYSKGGSPLQFLTNGGSQLQLQVSHTASAVNYVQVTGAATGGGPIISAQGSDTDVRLNFTSKGTNSIDMLTNSASTRQFRFAHTASAVNYLQATGSITGSGVPLSAQGTDTNIDIILTPKGTGSVLTGASISATGNILTAGFASATGNITGGNINTAGLVTATGNVIAGNVTTAGLITATGNVTGGNIITAGQVSATGNINTATSVHWANSNGGTTSVFYMQYNATASAMDFIFG